MLEDDLTKFGPDDAYAAHAASVDYRHSAAGRMEKRPSTAAAHLKQAERLERLRDKILERLTPEQRAAYPPHRAASSEQKHSTAQGSTLPPPSE